MSEQLDPRSYNDFNLGAIYDNLGQSTNQAGGWKDDYFGNGSTPINADNLNAMLNMLIYIRNVIGKTEDFATDINGSTAIPTPDPDKLDNNSIAKYLEAAFNAIIGTENDTSNTPITRTLNGLKAYLESLDAEYSEETSKWITAIEQIDGKISSVKLKQPDADDISVNNINIKDKAEGTTYSNLTEVINDESTIRNTQVTNVNARIGSLNLASTSEESQWVKSITQTAGQIAAKYSQPNASDISYTKANTDINISDKTTLDEVVRALDTLIGDLSDIKYNESGVESVSDALIKEKGARENQRNTIKEYVDEKTLGYVVGEQGTGTTLGRSLTIGRSGDIDQIDIEAIDYLTLGSSGAVRITAQNEQPVEITANSVTINDKEVATQEYIGAQIEALDYSDTAEDNKFVTSVSQTDGKISVIRSTLTADDIPSITHGKISDFTNSVKNIKVDNATNADNDSNGNKIVDIYATKTDLQTVSNKVDNIQLTDDNVKLSAPYIFTKDFGYYTLDGASYKSFGKAGQTLKSFLEGAFSEVDNDVLKEQPSYTVSISGDISAEIGTSITPKATVNATAGSYEYGTPDQKKTGITYSESSLNPSSFNTLTYKAESQTLAVTANATRAAATNKPINNLGKEIDIPSSIVSATSVEATATKTFIGYREGCFYGSVSGVSSSSHITAWLIRNLDHKLKANYSSKSNLNHTVSIGDTAIIIACPSDKTGPISVLNTTVNAEMFNEANFKTMILEIGGADSTSSSVGYYSTNYKVWYYIPAEAYSSSANLQIDLG